jgi:type IV secretory pathway TraG/TraD family ATPase VirD4
MLIVGKTGSGKTTRFMLRSIFAAIRNRKMSLVVIDAQRTEEERIIRYTRRIRGKKAKIIRLNWLDPEQSTHYWNCLDGIVHKSDAYDIASSLTSSMGNRHSGDGFYFQYQATQLISALIRGLAKEDRASLGEVRRVLDAGAGELRKLADRTHIPELRRFADEADSGTSREAGADSEPGFRLAVMDGE